MYGTVAAAETFYYLVSCKSFTLHKEQKIRHEAGTCFLEALWACDPSPGLPALTSTTGS
jgi:hypothetical protein